MSKLESIVFFILVCASLLAPNAGRAQNQAPDRAHARASTPVQGVRIESEVFVHDPSKKYLSVLQMNKSQIIDHVNRAGYEVYGSALLPDFLAQAGIPFVEKVAMPMSAASGHPSFDELTASLKSIALANPNIMTLFSIGKSVEGRDLWVIKVSDNPEQDEVEPEFKYISSMHGDEITGRELMVKLLSDMGKAYLAGDSAMVDLVNSTEIFIMPSMNPDGTAKVQRANARGADLNRNFPELSGAHSNDVVDLARLEIETQLLMKFQSERQFSLSANFHGGAEVVNYPWDAIPELHPLDKLIYDISLDYSQKVPYIYASTEFAKGVTNGYAWYQVLGGMQDWSYLAFNDLQITIELSDVKWADFSRMNYYYGENKAALLSLIKNVHQGAGFIASKAGLKGTVRILTALGQDLGSFSFRNSEFYKVLEPGTYDFLISVSGAEAPIKVNFNVSREAGAGDGYKRVEL